MAGFTMMFFMRSIDPSLWVLISPEELSCQAVNVEKEARSKRVHLPRTLIGDRWIITPNTQRLCPALGNQPSHEGHDVSAPLPRYGHFDSCSSPQYQFPHGRIL